MINLLRQLELKKICVFLFSVILFGFALSGVINVGDYFQIGFFEYLNDIEQNGFNYTYDGFPSFANFFKSHLLNNVFLSSAIIFPCMFFKKARSVFYSGVLWSFILITVFDFFYLYENEIGSDSYYESFFSNLIGSPFLSGFIVLFFYLQSKILRINTGYFLKCLISFFVFIFIYFLLSIFCYLFIMFFNKPMPVSFLVEAKGTYSGIINNNSNRDDYLVMSGKPSSQGVSFVGEVKKINFKSRENINAKVAFFANCISSPPDDFPNKNYFSFNDVKELSYDFKSTNAIAIMKIISKSQLSNFDIYNWEKIQFRSLSDYIYHWVSGEDTIIRYNTENSNIDFSIIEPSFVEKETKNLNEFQKTISLNINGELLDFKFNISRLKVSDKSNMKQCYWISNEDIKDTGVTLPPNLTVGMAVQLSVDSDSYLRYFENNGSEILISGLDGYIISGDYLKIDEFSTSTLAKDKIKITDESNDKKDVIKYSFGKGKVGTVQLFDISKFIVDGNVIDTKEHSSVFVFGNDVDAAIKDNNDIIIFGKTSNLYLDGKRVTKTLWERFDLFSIFIMSISGLLSPILIYSLKHVYVIVKQNNNIR